MREMDILDYFYDELRARGATRESLYISLDESVAGILSEKLGVEVPVTELHKYADICIANEWLERTTADVEYNYLTLTEAGLQVAIAYQYTNRKKNENP